MAVLAARPAALARGVRLEAFTVAWMAIESAVDNIALSRSVNRSRPFELHVYIRAIKSTSRRRKLTQTTSHE